MSNIIKETEIMLNNAGIDTSRFESKVIYDFLKQNFTSEDEILREAEKIVQRRKIREPLQYIIGEWEFYGDLYKLNRHCLIPRPETEFLTETIINKAGRGEKIADLCCGSGCVAISALKRREDLTCVSVDISPEAVSIAKKNAEINGVAGRIEFHTADIIKQTDNVKNLIRGCTLIASNPPYLNDGDMEIVRTEKTEVSHEPEIALYGGDGYVFYRHIIEYYSTNAHKIIFEAGINQTVKITEMLKEKGYEIEITNDYNKIERIVYGSYI